MEDERTTTEMKVGDLEEVLIQTTTDEYWTINKEHCFCTRTIVHSDGSRGRTPKDAMFIAFYRTDPVKKITHIARVKLIQPDVPAREVYAGTSREEEAGEERVKVYRFERPVELQRKINLGERGAPRDFEYTDIISLLSAITMEDL